MKPAQELAEEWGHSFGENCCGMADKIRQVRVELLEKILMKHVDHAELIWEKAEAYLAELDAK